MNPTNYISVSASIYTQAFISIDRLRSICRPFRQLLRATNTSNQLLLILCLIWLWSLLQASVQLFVSQVQITSEHSEDGNASNIYLCLETWPDDLDRQMWRTDRPPCIADTIQFGSFRWTMSYRSSASVAPTRTLGENYGENDTG